jgi:hypothetical protein
MGILSRLLGFRWSLYLTHSNSIEYAILGDTPMQLLGYVVDFFKNGPPRKPWEIRLNFNKTHESVHVLAEHITDSGIPRGVLTDELRRIDPKQGRAWRAVVFVNAQKKAAPASEFFDALRLAFDRPADDHGDDEGHFENAVVIYSKVRDVSAEDAARVLRPMSPGLRDTVLAAAVTQKGQELSDQLRYREGGPQLLKDVAKQAEDALTSRGFRQVDGFCHILWAEMQGILLEEYGITWHSPADMNPDIQYS